MSSDEELQQEELSEEGDRRPEDYVTIELPELTPFEKVIAEKAFPLFKDYL